MDYASCSGSKQPSMAANNGGKDKKKSAKKGKGVKLSTDPQSVAARERRHRISDRFKILQSLVPGGSKMDTVSMLEEAIQYVKFLKTQIWLHQAMIDYVDDDPTRLFSPINGYEVLLPDPHQQTTSDMYSSFNLDAQLQAMPPQVGFQDYNYLQEEENMSFDAQMMY